MSEDIQNIISEIFRSWPFWSCVGFSIFIFIFRKDISKFIEKMKITSKIGTIESQKEPEEIQKEMQKEKFIELKSLEEHLKEKEEKLRDLEIRYKKEKIEKEKVIGICKSYESLVKDLLETNRLLIKKNEELNKLVKLWFFNFLNVFLVYNTKQALLFFKMNGPMTKELFKKKFYLPPIIPDHELEKETIFNVLLTYRLIELNKEDSLYHITSLGEEFLKFVGLIP
jgi:hypothetical protein